MLSVSSLGMTSNGHPDGVRPRWSVVVPYYNEAAGFLEPTLRSLVTQTPRPLTLILVDNDSTDGSSAIARAVTDGIPSVTTLHLVERRPGQVYALETGLAAVETEFVAVCDADTLYPPHYLERAAALFDRHGPRVIAVLAMGVGADPNRLSARIKRWKGLVLSYVLKNQAHTGGYAHCFRTSDLRAAGGYSKRYWPYLLKDHDLIHRVLKRGRPSIIPVNGANHPSAGWIVRRFVGRYVNASSNTSRRMRRKIGSFIAFLRADLRAAV